jgi:hypothetical protein
VYAEFLDYEAQNHVFEEVIGGTFQDVLQSTTEGTEQFSGGTVTPNMFRFLGVPAMLGRTLLPDDARAGAPAVFVMSYKLWFKRTAWIPRSSARLLCLTASLRPWSASCRRGSLRWERTFGSPSP